MDFAPPVAARRCTGSPAPGAVALASEIAERYGHRGYYLAGIYNCRTVAGSQTLSLHAEGRAVDLGVAGSDSGVGTEILHAVLTMGDFTLQRVIFDGTIYDHLSGAGGRPFGGDPHVDHLHVELSWPAARGEIPLELDVDDLQEDDMDANLIVAYRGAQWVVAADLSSRTGIPSGADLAALLDVAQGRAYVAATLSESLMGRIPVSGDG